VVAALGSSLRSPQNTTARSRPWPSPGRAGSVSSSSRRARMVMASPVRRYSA
jgi:hypothetical protein